jgi:uncharacterized membrane protein
VSGFLFKRLLTGKSKSARPLEKQKGQPKKQLEATMDISQFLVYLAGVGAVFVISWLFEGWQGYQTLANPRTKQLIFFAACAVVAIGAQLVIVFVPPAVLTVIAPYFAIVAALFANIFLGTGFHNTTKLQ